jgi:hypothetical protein
MKYQKDPNIQAKEYVAARIRFTNDSDSIEKIVEEAWLAGNAASNQEWLHIKDFLPDLNEQVLVYGRAKSKYEWKVQPAMLKTNWVGKRAPFKPEFYWDGYDIIDFDGETDEIVDVEYWMPLPLKPSAKWPKL